MSKLEKKDASIKELYMLLSVLKNTIFEAQLEVANKMADMEHVDREKD